jgi:hypothetical protein
MKEARSTVDTLEEPPVEPNGIWVDLTDSKLFHASNNYTAAQKDKHE